MGEKKRKRKEAEEYENQLASGRADFFGTGDDEDNSYYQDNDEDDRDESTDYEPGEDEDWEDEEPDTEDCKHRRMQTISSDEDGKKWLVCKDCAHYVDAEEHQKQRLKNLGPTK